MPQTLSPNYFRCDGGAVIKLGNPCPKCGNKASDGCPYSVSVMQAKIDELTLSLSSSLQREKGLRDLLARSREVIGTETAVIIDSLRLGDQTDEEVLADTSPVAECEEPAYNAAREYAALLKDIDAVLSSTGSET